MSTEFVLNAVNVSKNYYRNESQTLPDGTRRRKTLIQAVGDVSLSVKKGEVVGILGESGCGKSTLGRLLVGLEPTTAGTIELGGESVSELLRRDRKALRRRAQMIFQNPFDAFDSRHKMSRVLAGTLALHKIGTNTVERLEIAQNALESAGLRPGRDFLRRFPSELSGGQLQRIAILRSMLLGPDFVVADEPVSMLDVSVRADIINMLGRLAREHGTSVVFISHDISTTRYIADRIVVMYLGQVVEQGAARDVIANPLHPYTRALVSNCPSADPRVPFNPVKLTGEAPSPVNLPAGCYFAPRCSSAQPQCFQTPQKLESFGDGRLARCSVIFEK